MLVMAISLLTGFAQESAAYDYVISVKVYLNGALVPVQYPQGLDVTGYCFLGGAYMANSEGVPNGVLHVQACWGDSLFFTMLNPTIYGAGATLNCWQVDGHCVETGLGYMHYPAGSKTIRVLLSSSGATDPRDPVSARWAPDAARRAGGSLLWGPMELAARAQVADVESEAFPALLYAAAAFEKQTDLAVPGRGLDFVFSRVHRSDAPNDGGPYFADGWTHNFDLAMTGPFNNINTPVSLALGNGTEAEFRCVHYDSDTRFYYAPGWDAELRLELHSNPPVYPFPGHFELVFGDGLRWTFADFADIYAASTTRIETITDRFGNTIALAYDGNNRLQTITDSLGRAYTLAYNPDDSIASLTEEDGLGRVIAYAYASGNLSAVVYPATDAFPAGTTIAYDYDGDGRLSLATDSRSNIALANDYDPATGRLTSQQFGQGPEAASVVYEYVGLSLEDGESRAVRVVDGVGNTTEHFFNSGNQRVRMLRVVGDDALVTRVDWYTYSLGARTISDDLPDRVVLPDGTIITYAYMGQLPGGLDDAHYRYRMNLLEVEQAANDGSGKKRTERFAYHLLDYWNVRFGPSFHTCHATSDETGAILTGAAYIYSADGLGMLDGVNYLGLDPYSEWGDASLCACGFEDLVLLAGEMGGASDDVLVN